MNDNVISLKSRRPLKEIEEEAEKQKQEIDQAFLDAQLELLDKVREQIAAGNLANLVIVSRNPQSGMFMQEMIFEPHFHISGLAFGFAGVLQALNLEVADIACLSPTIAADGTKVDPHFDDEIAVEEGDW